jgi:hypothetical protein
VAKEANAITVDMVTQCPMQGRSFVVSVENSCKKCDYFKEVMEKDSEKMIPAKVHCLVPNHFYNVIAPLKEIDFATMREKKGEE